MRRRTAIAAPLALGLLAVAGCAKPSVWVPPRIELLRYGTVGLVEFRAPGGHAPLATQQFLAAVHTAQAGVPVLELGPLPEVLDAVGHAAMGPEAARAVGERYGVDALVLGDLDLDAPRPSFSVHAFTRADASAEILGTLSTRLLDAHSGATIWSDAARGKRTVAHVGLGAGRRPDLSAVDPEGEQEKLVAWLVERVTRDFRGHWTRP